MFTSRAQFDTTLVRKGLKGGLVCLLVALLPILTPIPAGAVQVSIPASKDNTLYQLESGTASNGAGEYLFTGRTKEGFNRRGVIHFDVAAVIPSGSTVNSVTLQMHVSRTKNSNPRTTSLHRLLADWGQGTSNAGQQEGQGAPPTTNDATWNHRFYPGTLWATLGGDFVASSSASVIVTGNVTYVWSGAGLVADVQSWVNTPAMNFGWLIRGDESTTETTKRFDSRENGQTANRPVLIVDYTPSGGGLTGACCYADTCEVMTAAACASLSGTYQGDGTTCTPDPCPVSGAPDTLNALASADNTLYESATGALSNGAGTKMIVSLSNSTGLIRRGIIRFDLSALPAGATIQNATLKLYNAQGGTNSIGVTVHRATASWGEGTSLATGSEDAGAPSTTNDATWIHRFYSSTLWTVPGSDFIGTASATTTVGNEGFYLWSSPTLVTDVQGWFNDPSTNFGWIVRGRENGGGNSLKRFESRQSTDTTRRPVLEIVYVMPAGDPTGACCFENGLCDTLTAAECALQGGTYQGDGTTCGPGLCPVTLQPFLDPLPLPAVATPITGTPGGVATYDLAITEFNQQLHAELPPTRVWGYGGTYPGPTIEASTDLPVTVNWTNDLRNPNGTLRTTHYLPVDLCLKGPDSLGATPRTVSHLHGGHVPSSVDGYPMDTILPGQQTTYVYPNHQSAATLWYHDHAMGITRLNVMMGLAGLYVLRDSVENSLGLPSGAYEVPLVIQDRTFNPDGSFHYPAMWDEHFFGDKVLVNGKVWPYFEVNRGKYRFRVLNGSNSRVYRLALSSGDPFLVIGTEGGLLPAPVSLDSLLITPGERVDVVVDFGSKSPGTEILLTNDAPAPFPGVSGEGVIPQIMKFIVKNPMGFTGSIPGVLRPVPPLDPGTSATTRDLRLKKMPNACSGSMWTINGLGFEDLVETPWLGSTEIWRFINDSGVVHPMHMHLVMFQVLDRQPYTLVGDSIVTTGPPVPPHPSEAGWKDTAPVLPNQILRVIAKFEDYTGKYPYHCHILEHEDHEMMRQFEVIASPSAIPEPSPIRLILAQNRPNPFDQTTTITFVLDRDEDVDLRVFDVAGREVKRLAGGRLSARQYDLTWDGRDERGLTVPSGMYFVRLEAGEKRVIRKMVRTP